MVAERASRGVAGCSLGDQRASTDPIKMHDVPSSKHAEAWYASARRGGRTRNAAGSSGRAASSALCPACAPLGRSSASAADVARNARLLACDEGIPGSALRARAGRWCFSVSFSPWRDTPPCWNSVGTPLLGELKDCTGLAAGGVTVYGDSRQSHKRTEHTQCKMLRRMHTAEEATKAVQAWHKNDAATAPSKHHMVSASRRQNSTPPAMSDTAHFVLSLSRCKTRAAVLERSPPATPLLAAAIDTTCTLLKLVCRVRCSMCSLRRLPCTRLDRQAPA